MMNATAIEQMNQDLLNGPAMVPPLGVIPNFDDPPSLGHTALMMLALEMSLATTIVLMRMYIKMFIVGRMVYEDCMSSFGLFVVLIMMILMFHRHHRYRMGENL